MRSTPVYVVDGARSPFLRARNAPGPFSAADLATQVGRGLLLRQPFAPSAVNEVILGCAAPAPNESNIARVVALRLGCGHSVPAWTVMRNCASGMQALDSAVMSIRSGRSQLVLAGGVDALSRAPVLFHPATVAWLAELAAGRSLARKFRTALKFRPRLFKPVIGLLQGLTDPVVNLSMGQTAENLAQQFGITRQAMDRYALRSHQRAVAADFSAPPPEILPLVDDKGRHYTHDDGIRSDTSMERLSRLKAVFDPPFGQITAGNSSQVSDGAALLLLASPQAIKQHGLEPLAEIVDTQWSGLDPAVMGLGPVYASTQLLARHNLSLDAPDLWELNEAFAAQVLACLAAWGDETWCLEHLGVVPDGTVAQDALNVDGGAIALGHPVGATGARLVLHLVHALRAQGKTLGVATLCIGGGQGGAMLVRLPEAL